jgi:hypothetical protein
MRHARVGDAVVLRATKNIRQNGETVIPKGSAILGRITEIKRYTKDRSGSAVTMVFDRIENDGKIFPVTARIVSVTNIATSAGISDDLSSHPGEGSRTPGTASPTGAGLTGGLGNALGGVVGTGTQALGSTVNTATQTSVGTLGSAGRTVGGIQFTSSAGGAAAGSSTIATSDRNLRLEKGAKFNLAVNAQMLN